MTTLNITDAGVQASNNASAGGVFVSVATYKAGDSNQAHNNSDTDIAGATIHAGNVSFVEVKSANSAVFTFDIPAYVGTVDGVEINELAVFLPGNIMYARAVLASPFVKVLGKRARFRAILTTVACDLTTINVTVGDYSNVPAAAFVRNLPDPASSEHNVVTVLDLNINPDGTTSPGIAMRYGAGGSAWGFMGYDRIIATTMTTTTPTTFTKTGLATQLGAVNDEVFIVQAISGVGSPDVRKMKYSSGSDVFLEYDGTPWTAESTSTVYAFWKAVDNGSIVPGSNDTYPDTVNVPPDWVLTRGPSGIPVWAPPVECNGSLNTLYEEPSTLNFTTITLLGNDRDRRFSLGGLKPKNINYLYTALGSVTQHRGAFSLLPAELEFAEIIPSTVQIDLCVMTKTVSDGMKLEIFIDQFTGDGTTLRFPLSNPIESAEYAWIFIAGGKQSMTAYTLDTNTDEIVFTEPPNQGVAIEVYGFQKVPEAKYSTRVSTTTIITEDNTVLLELPFSPQNKNQVLISNSGVHVHSNLYSLSNNIIALSAVIPKGREVEIMVFDNVRADGSVQTNLKGVVTDAVVTSKSLELHRHDSLPIKLPIPGVAIEAGDGIRVTGVHPNYKITNTVAEKAANAAPQSYNRQQILEDSEEIVVTQRVNITSDMILMVNADFMAELGPGFVTERGLEYLEYSIGYRVAGQSTEPPYGRNIKGTGRAGFNTLIAEVTNNQKAYGNASATQTFALLKRNITTGYVDIVAKMRVREANVSFYNSLLIVDMNILTIPK